LPVLAANVALADPCKILLLTAFHGALVALPAAAVAAVAAHLGCRSVAGLLAAALLGLGAAGFAAFWVYLLSPTLGHLFSFAVLGGSLAMSGGLLAASSDVRQAARGLALPAALWLAYAAFVLAVGFAYGGLDAPLETAGSRFTHYLPGDNWIPLLFAQALNSVHRPIPSPLYGGWQSSDRPPLQTGLVLIQMPLLGWRQALQYEVVGALLQALFVPALWAWAVEWRAHRPAASLGIAVAATSGFALVNTFYVWPKLLPAAYLVLLAAILLGPRFPQTRSRGMWALAAGGLAGCAMLGHEGSAFALFAIGLSMLLFRRLPSIRFAVLALLAALALLGPWIVYQRVIDPPGDRLTRLHLAGDDHIATPGTLPAIRQAYEQVGATGALKNKVANARYIFGDPAADVAMTLQMLRDAGSRPGAVRVDAAWLRFRLFFELFPWLGLMAFGPLALAAFAAVRSRLPAEEALVRGALIAFITAGLLLAVWCSLIFGPATTAPHAGTYLPELLLLVGSTWTFLAVSRRFGLAVCAIQVAFNVLLYVLLSPAPGASYASLHGSGLNLATAFLATACGLTFSWLLLRQPLSEAPSSREVTYELELPSNSRRQAETAPAES
jgi:hypothetical protein